MSKELIEVPDFNPHYVLYILEVEQYINGLMTHRDSKPIIIRYSKKEKEQHRYWAKFIFKTLQEDPLASLWKIQKVYQHR